MHLAAKRVLLNEVGHVTVQVKPVFFLAITDLVLIIAIARLKYKQERIPNHYEIPSSLVLIVTAPIGRVILRLVTIYVHLFNAKRAVDAEIDSSSRSIMGTPYLRIREYIDGFAAKQILDLLHDVLVVAGGFRIIKAPTRISQRASVVFACIIAAP